MYKLAVFSQKPLSFVMRMELCATKLIALFQDIDAVSLYSQLILDDITPDCTFLKRREDEATRYYCAF